MKLALLCCDPDVRFGDGYACPSRLRGLAYGLARAGHEVTAICAGSEPGQSELGDAVAVRALRLPVSVREIDWHFSRVQPDAVIEWHVPGSLEGARAAAEAGVPHLYDLSRHSLGDGISTSAAVRGALPEALGLSRGAIAPTARVAARVRELAGERYPLDVIGQATAADFLAPPEPEDVARVERVLVMREEPVRIGFYGPLAADCGLIPLVKALGRVPREQRPRLLVFGDGPERNPALIAAEDAHVGLVLAGRVVPREAPAHLALLDIAVVPGDEDGGVPQALIEAMATQRAVIAPKCDAIAPFVRDGRDALLVPPDDVDALADALLPLMADAPRREKLGHHARRTVMSEHTWDARAAQLAAFAERVAERSMSEPAVVRVPQRA